MKRRSTISEKKKRGTYSTKGKVPHDYTIMYRNVMRDENTPLAKFLRAKKYGYATIT